MILENGKTQGGSVQQNSDLSKEQILEILKTSNDNLLQNIGSIISKLDGKTYTKDIFENDELDSLKDISKMMASNSDVDQTNFKDLGKQEDIKGDKKQDKTIDLLKDLL